MHPYKADSQIYTSCLEHSSNFKFFCPTFYWTSPLRYAIDQNKLWNILQETQIPDHFTCLLRNLYAGQEATVRTRHGTTDSFQIGKGVHQGCIYCHPVYLTYLQSTLVKAMVFPVVMYGCENWTTKKAECWRIDAFKLWCWRRLLRIPWTARRSNQSIYPKGNQS